MRKNSSEKVKYCRAFSYLCNRLCDTINDRTINTLKIKTMKNVLVIGSTGQIGSELTMKLRGIYGNANVVAGYIKGAEPKGELLESGPAEEVDITNAQQIADAIVRFFAEDWTGRLSDGVREEKKKYGWDKMVAAIDNV